MFQKKDPDAKSKQLKEDWTTYYNDGRAIAPIIDPEQLLILAETNEIHSACLHAKATDAIGRGHDFKPKRKNEQIDSEDEERTRAIQFLEVCNEDMTFQELLWQAAWEFLAVGWSAWEFVRAKNVYDSGIFPMPAHTVRATDDHDVFVQLRNGRTKYFKRFGVEGVLNAKTGKWMELPPDRRDEEPEVDALGVVVDPELDADSIETNDENFEEASEIITFTRYSPRSPFYGIPGYVSAAPAMAEYAAIRDFNVTWFETSGVMSRMMFIKSQSNVEEVVKLVSDVMRDAAGRYHSTLVSSLPPDASVEEVNLAPEMREGHFQKRREDLVKSILIAHNVPPYRIGWALIGQMGGAPARDMLTAYRHGEVEPVQVLFERKLAATIFGPKGLNLQNWQLVFSDLDWNETELNLNIAVRGVQAGVFSPNQGKQILGFDPDPDPALDGHYYRGIRYGQTNEAKTAMDVLADLKRSILLALEQEEARGSNKGARAKLLAASRRRGGGALRRPRSNGNGKTEPSLPGDLGQA